MPAINWKRIRKEQVQKRITNSGFDFHTCKKILDKFIRISRWLRTLQNFTKQYTNGASQQLEGTSNLSINFVLTNDCKLSRQKSPSTPRPCVTGTAGGVGGIEMGLQIERANTRYDLNHSVTFWWSSNNKWTVFNHSWCLSSASFFKRDFNHPELKVPTNKGVYRHIYI